MGRAWAELMKRLGYTSYVAQGGDWGAFVVDQMGLQAPTGLLAIHTNMPATVPADVDKASLAGEPPPAGLSAEERRAYEQLIRTDKQVEYARMMAARPQTLYGIADLPVGLAAWLLDHNDADGQPAAAVVAGLHRTSSATGELTRDEILDNITLYWLTNTGVSASRLYWEYRGGFFNAKGVKIPVAVTVFPGEQYQAPRSWTETAYPKLIYYHRAEKGGHFAAWEQPMIFILASQGGVQIATLSQRTRTGFAPFEQMCGQRSIALPRDGENDHVGTAFAGWQTPISGLHVGRKHRRISFRDCCHGAGERRHVDPAVQVSCVR